MNNCWCLSLECLVYLYYIGRILSVIFIIHCYSGNRNFNVVREDAISLSFVSPFTIFWKTAFWILKQFFFVVLKGCFSFQNFFYWKIILSKISSKLLMTSSFSSILSSFVILHSIGLSSLKRYSRRLILHSKVRGKVTLLSLFFGRSLCFFEPRLGEKKGVPALDFWNLMTGFCSFQ